jgi:type II secretory pathway component PulJ
VRRLAIRDERGFTLSELLVVLPMITIVLGGLIVTLTTLVHGNDQTREVLTLQTEARAAFTALEADIRSAYVGDGTSPIVSASATSITLDSPDRYPTVVNGTTETSFHLRQITYSVANGTLQRQFLTSTNTFPSGPPWTWSGTPGPQQTLLASITNTDVFSYYTADGVQASPPTPLGFPISASSAGIRAVGVKLTLSSGGSKPVTFTVNETIALREMDG